jgi:polyisoprenyl-phosphate glycosyltransferase
MRKLISVVLPSYNEEQNITLVYQAVSENIVNTPYDTEFIFVNDGSGDGTWAAIQGLIEKDPRVRGINFSRNFGHHAALQAGLEVARGDAVIMMDADLQHPAGMLPDLIAAWEGGNEIVNTVRLSTERVGLFKRLTGKVFYKLMNSMSDLTLNDGEADFRLLDRRVVDVLNGLQEAPKFYRGLVNWIGFSVARLEYRAEARRYGRSSYSVRKMVELARLGLTSFSTKPLKFIIGFGVTLSVLSALMICVMLGVKIAGNPLHFTNTAILIMFVIFVAGVLSTFQGIVAVYLVDIFYAAKGRPTYIVKGTAGEE